MPIAERFWPKVNKDGPVPEHRPELGACWIWTAALSDNGYGRLGQGRAGAGMVYAHRVAYELSIGEIPAGCQLHHVCENKRCVNYAHLEAVTAAQHVRRDGRLRNLKCQEASV